MRIKQVFRYLLLSYLNQASYGSVYLEIKGELIPAEHSIKLKCRIATTGEGLTEEEIDETFGAYSSYDSRQRSNFRGMGLELSICKAILDMMGGSLDIKSIVKIGTAVSFEFSNYIIDDECIISRIRKYSSMPLIYLRTKSDESGWQAIMEEFDFSPTYVLGPVAFKIAIENKKYSQIYVPDSVYPEVAGIIESAGCEDYTYVITDCMHSYKDFGDCKILRHPVYCLNLIESIDGSWKAADYQKPIDNVRITFPGAKILIVDDSIVKVVNLAPVDDVDVFLEVHL